MTIRELLRNTFTRRQPPFTDTELNLIITAAMARARESLTIARGCGEAMVIRAKVDRIQADSHMWAAAQSQDRFLHMSAYANREAALFIRVGYATPGPNSRGITA